MIFSRNLHASALAIQISSKKHFDEDFSLEKIKRHLSDKEYWAIFEKGLIGAAYYNGDDFHIGMIKKGLGAKVINKLTANRKTRAVINNEDERTLKLVSHLGFEFVNRDNKYTYMVKQ